MARALLCLALPALCACHRHTPGEGGAGAGASQTAEGASQPAASGAFARPLAAAWVPSRGVMVAGFVPGRSAIALAQLSPAKRSVVDVVPGVMEGTSGELRVFPEPDGAAVVYRGSVAGKAVTRAAFVDGLGQRTTTLASGVACATDTALAWVDRASGQPKVLSLAWKPASPSDAMSPVELMGLWAGRDPTLACGAQTVYALGEGEDDTALTTSGAPPRTRVVMRDRDFQDEEREHEAFVVGDTLRVLRVGQTGVMWVRELGSELPPWRRLGKRLASGDDVVAVDGDVESTTVVTTREDPAGCDAQGATSVVALRVGTAAAATAAGTAPKEDALDVAGPDCEVERGPFWTEALSTAFVIAWVERTTDRRQGQPGIVGLSYRTIGPGGALGELRKVPRRAVEMVDAGCDKERCYAVALAPPGEGDGSQPEGLSVIAYP